ncbi:hypothetical protein HHL16_04430 [Pseudoflavitalea sp. G-6-1-2]|uniref:hypothetical protein n=1 Tax=Pseudoflavitalea sp. G-6-1-2 TaxID=2728841 RepID=UPI00146B64AD|nr:hypothetical protein [Pseudoflavitalea sp. G-6-1-2]NML20106.1 hypothetical protein [Pseudoflavitalea sp. G-6-1-2]
MRKPILLALILPLLLLTSLKAQQSTVVNKLPNDFLHFFLGDWTGDGEFASGRKISANLSFKLTSDSSWIQYQHTDKLPNTYKALSLWGIDNQTGQFVAFIFDKGNRKFVSNGWVDDKLILTHIGNSSTGPVFQHFKYEKSSDTSFKMTFETSKDGISWKLIDYLIFTKEQ